MLFIPEILKENRGVWGYMYVPPGNFTNLVSLKWHFLHFDIIFVVFYKVFILITDIFGLFFAFVNPSFQNQTLRSQSKQFFALFSDFHDKLGESDKNRESGRRHIKSGGLESLSFCSYLVLFVPCGT